MMQMQTMFISVSGEYMVWWARLGWPHTQGPWEVMYTGAFQECQDYVKAPHVTVPHPTVAAVLTQHREAIAERTALIESADRDAPPADPSFDLSSLRVLLDVAEPISTPSTPPPVVPEDRREYMDRTIGSGPDKTLTLMIQVQHPDADDL